MSIDKTTSNADSFADITDAVCDRLAKNERVRRTLPGHGRLRIDRQLPFLCINRTPDHDDAGTRQLVTSEAAYLFASGKREFHAGLLKLCQQITATLQEHFGTFLSLEIWADSNCGQQEVQSTAQPAFEIFTPDFDSMPSTIEAFTVALAAVNIDGHDAVVSSQHCDEVAPPGLQPLNHICPEASPVGCCTIGLAVRPIYRDPQSGVTFPMILRDLRWQLSRALRKAIAQFAGLESSADGAHFESLGPTSLVKAARLIDQQLCEVAESFDFLLQVTPVNSEAAWEEFQEHGYQQEPNLHYRPLPWHTSLLKRRLFDIEIERIEDATLDHLCWEKQEEIDRQLTALRDINTPHFLHSSLQLYGAPDDSLVKLAETILQRFPEPTAATGGEGCVSTDTIVERSREEIDHYHQQMHEFNAKVEVCDQIASGMMVSGDRLLISPSVKLQPDRLEALMHHEIGTHLLTYFNGRCQPFRQLYSGLAGYDELQEGLAIMSEYLTGGLTANRLRSLAGRVIAVRSMISGASFTETFSRLHYGLQFSARQAFVTTLRVFRGGGLTKDFIYLRGLKGVLDYLSGGHDIEPLYVGKIGLHHLPYIQEMRRRGILDAPGVLPRFWDDDGLRDRLEACRGLTVPDLVENER